MIRPQIEARLQAILADEPPAPGLFVEGIAADRPDTERPS